MKACLFVLLWFLGNVCYSQHLLNWSFEYEFTIDKSQLSYQLDSMNLFINNSEAYLYHDKGKLVFNKEKSKYNLLLEYNCLGCIVNEPPDLYIKLFLNEKVYNKKFVTYIPIYFTPSSELSVKHDLKVIKLADFMHEYEAIEVDSEGRVHKRKKGEYKWKRMDKLIKVKSQ